MELDSSDEEEENRAAQPAAVAPDIESSSRTNTEQPSPVAPLAAAQPSSMGLTPPAMPPIPVSPMMAPHPPSLFASTLPPLPMSMPHMGFPMPPMPVPPMQALPMPGPPIQALPMQAPPMQTPPMQAPPMQTPPMQAPPMSFPLTLAPLPPKTEAQPPPSQQLAGSESLPATQENEMMEKKPTSLDERLSDMVKNQPQLRDKLWQPQSNDEQDQKQTVQQSSTAVGTLASLPKQTTTVSDGVKSSKPEVTFDTNALRALLGTQQKNSLQPNSPSQQSLHNRREEQPESDDITRKVGNALVTTLSTQESLKKVLELWMKRGEGNGKKEELQGGAAEDSEPTNSPVSPRLQGQRRPVHDELSPRVPPPFHERMPPPRERHWGPGHSPPPSFAPHGRPPHSFPHDERPLSPRGRLWKGRPPPPPHYREHPPRPNPWDFPPDGRVPPGIAHRGGNQDKWQMRSPPELDQDMVKPFHPHTDEEWGKRPFEPNDMAQELPNRLLIPRDPSEGSSSEHHWETSHHEGPVMSEGEYNGEEDAGWEYSEEVGFDSHDPIEEDQPPYEGDEGEDAEVQSQEYRHHEFSRRTPPPSWHPFKTHPQSYSEDTIPPDWPHRPLPPAERTPWGREQPHWRHAPPPRRSPPHPYGHPRPPMQRSPPMEYHRGPPPRMFERRPPPQPWFAGGKRSPSWLPPPPPKRAPL